MPTLFTSKHELLALQKYFCPQLLANVLLSRSSWQFTTAFDEEKSFKNAGIIEVTSGRGDSRFFTTYCHLPLFRAIDYTVNIGF